MKRIRAAAGLLASVALVGAAAGPVAAEPLPATLSIETSVAHYLGGWWEPQLAIDVTCEGYQTLEVWVDLPGARGDVLADLGPVPAGTTCWVEVGQWPDPGWNAGWNETEWTPGPPFVLAEGENVLGVVFPRTWVNGWPPEDDTAFEHDLALTVDRVYLNGRGGIEVEGTSWCPDAAALGGEELGLFANANWSALQYAGRKAALHATYESAIAHPCWEGAAPGHGPYGWQTRYPYPDGGLQFVYSPDGRFAGGSIHVEAFASTETSIVTQRFAPGAWTSFEGVVVPYDEDCDDSNGDGWCVAHHFWFGWAPADLKPIKLR